MGEVGGLPCPFLKIEKKCSDLGKNALTVRIYILSFSFNLSFSILRVSRSQNSKIFPCEATFLCVVRQIFIEMFFVSYSHQHCSSLMLQYFSRENVLPEIADAKGLNHWFSFLIFFQNVKCGFQFFCIWPLTNILQKYVFHERHFRNRTFFKLRQKSLMNEVQFFNKKRNL